MRFLRSLHLAVAILVLTIGVGSYADFKSEQMHGQNLRIQIGLERMVRLNHALTSSVATAVIEKNSLRAASYNSLQTELEATMQEVQALTRHMTLAGEMLALRDEQFFDSFGLRNAGSLFRCVNGRGRGNCNVADIDKPAPNSLYHVDGSNVSDEKFAGLFRPKTFFDGNAV